MYKTLTNDNMHGKKHTVRECFDNVNDFSNGRIQRSTISLATNWGCEGVGMEPIVEENNQLQENQNKAHSVHAFI